MATEEYQVGYEAGYQDGWNAAQQPHKTFSPSKGQFCFCGDEISLQMVSGGAAPEGLYGRVTLKVRGEYVNYVRTENKHPAAKSVQVLEFVAQHKSSDWPERCQRMVDMAREVLAAPVAQQPQEIEVQCPVCNYKFYEWPNDKQPQAEAVPVVDRVYEAAKRLVDHADFQLGGVLSAKSKARDIPSNAASKVKARHLASLRDALAKTPHQAEAVQYTRADLDRAYSAGLVEGERLAIQQAEVVPPGYVLVPVEPTAGMCKAAADAWLDCGSRLVLNKAGAAVRAAIAQQKGQQP